MNLFSCSQAAAYLGLSEGAVVRSYIRRGHFPHAKKIGRDWFLPKKDLDTLYVRISGRTTHP